MAGFVRFPGDIRWDEVEEGIRVTLFHLVVAISSTSEGFVGTEAAGLNLDLFPEEEVIWEINRHSQKRLGDNFARFIFKVMDREARKGLGYARDGRILGGRGATPFVYEVRTGYFEYFPTEMQLFGERERQARGCRPELDEKGSLQRDILLDNLSAEWVKVWAFPTPELEASHGYEAAYQKELLTALWRKAKGDNGREEAWKAQEILGVTLCPMCLEEAPGREIGKHFPEPCSDCSQKLQETGLNWCGICGQEYGPEEGCPGCN